MWGGLRGSLSLMYSSMHSPGRGVNRVERTLLNFFMWRGVRGGVFGALEGCIAGDFGATARREWDADGAFCRGIPRFLVWVRARRGDSAHGGLCRAVGAKKNFKKGAGKGEKPKNWGARGAGRWHGRTLYRVCGAIFRSGDSTSSSAARGMLRAAASTMSTSHEIPEIHPSYIGSYIWRVSLQAPSLTLRRHLRLSDP